VTSTSVEVGSGFDDLHHSESGPFRGRPWEPFESVGRGWEILRSPFRLHSVETVLPSPSWPGKGHERLAKVALTLRTAPSYGL
jgi:hypothetical protein